MNSDDDSSTGELPRARDVHNTFTGNAINVIQAGSIGSMVVHLPAPDVPVPQQLPRAATHFTNRTASLARLDELVAEPGDDPVVSTVAGPAGVGKTALVVHWAHQARNRFPDGILYANLRGFDPVNPAVDPGEILDGFLAALRVPESRIRGSVDSRASLFRTVVDSRRMLIVLDNAATATQVRPLLPGAATVAVVVTSRDTLLGLAVQDGAVNLDLAPLQAPDAIGLVHRVVGKERLTSQELAVARLTELCGYLPLPLRIVAERMAADPYLTVDKLVTELVDERNKLDVFETADPATAVRAVFSVSYQALPSEAARAFRLLGLNPGPDFGRAAAAALTELGGAKLRRALDSLVSANLLEAVGPDRFRFHDLVRVYTMECAENDEPPADRHQAIRAVLTWYLQTAQRADRALEPHRRPIVAVDRANGADFASPTAAVQWFSREHANLIAATRQAVGAGEPEIAWQMPVAMRNHLYRRKSWNDWTDTHEIGLEAAAEAGNPVAAAALLGSLAVAYREQHRYDEAESCFVRSLELWGELDDRYNLAWTINAYGQARREQGDLVGALSRTQRALALFLELADRHGEGVTSNSLSGIYRQMSELNKASEHSARSIDAFRAINDRYGEVWALNNLAAVHADLGELTQAADLYREVARQRGELGDTYGQVFTLSSLGQMLFRLGRTDEAVPLLRTVVTVFDELGDPRGDEVRALLDRSFNVDPSVG